MLIVSQYLELSNQRQEIVDRTAGLDLQVKVSQIKDTLQSLQEEMAQQCRDLSSVLGPLDTTHLMCTMKRLRDALQDVKYQNAYLVMNNNELSLENSSMTPTQRDTIKKIKAEQSHYYMQQRLKPHCTILRLIQKPLSYFNGTSYSTNPALLIPIPKSY